jgi:hypothetical protein
MGQVFRGSAADGNPVAVKRVPLRLDSDGERRRRDREVEIAAVLAELPTDNVLPTLDVGRVNDDLFIVMPLAKRSLAAALRAGELDEEARFDALRQVTEGLIELAAASILHRDLKPANVLEHDGRWRLADFGIARSLQEATGTYTFLGAGTAPYMAPELWNNQPATVKSDLYALGVIAYEVLTESRPFAGPDEYDYRRQHLVDAPPRADGAPSAVARLMLRLLAKNPAERPQDARAVAEALDASAKKLSAEQNELRRAALVAQERRSAAEAKTAAQGAAELAEQERVLQALADLQAILEEGRELVAEALGEADLRGSLGRPWFLSADGVTLTVEQWERPPTGMPAGDPLVVAGAITARDRTFPMANIVCEQRGDRLTWSLLRFEPSGLQSHSDRGSDQPYGFDRPSFYAERPRMVRQVIHVWTMQTKPLTPEAMAQLLSEAIEDV